MKTTNDFGNIEFESGLEMEFYDFLNNFELTSMISRFRSQVWVTSKRRVDFVLTLTNGYEVFIEIDGPRHSEDSIIKFDKYKDAATEKNGGNTIRISHTEFGECKQKLANKIEGIIDLLSGL